jgi:hypothetical protein
MYPPEYQSEEEQESKSLKSTILTMIIFFNLNIGSRLISIPSKHILPSITLALKAFLFIIILIIEDQRKFSIDDAIRRFTGYVKAFTDYKSNKQ